MTDDTYRDDDEKKKRTKKRKKRRRMRRRRRRRVWHSRPVHHPSARVLVFLNVYRS
jgi:hypothetical protein